jgi:phosphotransferase system  glucose/maltose/N-acetylglucosamine-specific IIC component
VVCYNLVENRKGEITMKEASGELNMTLITIVAIAAVAGLFALLWPRISGTINNKWDNAASMDLKQPN